MSTALFLDKPLLKVSRPVAACSRCRTAKIKCDGKLPACSACERVGKASTCSGASDEFARGKERSYVASLESYCERLEKKIQDLRDRKESLSLDDKVIIQESSITSASSTGTVSHSHRREVSDIDDLVGDFGFLSVNATSRDFHGITSSTSFANLLLSLSIAEPISKSPPRPVPPRHEITPLIQHYFDVFFSQLPFLTETSFWSSVDAVYQNGGRFARPYDNWVLRVVLAIACASMSGSSGDRNQRKALQLVSEALYYAEDVLRPGSVAGIQAIMLLAQYSLVDPTHFRSWYLVGMAVRAMVDLGLHQAHHAEAQPSAEQQDVRRRVFHCLYSMDRGISSAMELTFSLSDASVNVALPSLTSPTSSSADESHVFFRSSEPAWSMVKIRQILSAAYQKKYFNEDESSSLTSTSTWTLCSQANEWFNNTPTNAPQPFPTLYRLEFLYTTIIILTPSDRLSSLCDYSKFLLFNICLKYIHLLHQVLENPNSQPSLTYLDLQRACQAGRRFIGVLADDFDVLMSQCVPALPQVPDDCPQPPFLDCEDCLNCYSRAVDSLAELDDLLQYGVRKWQAHSLLNDFQRVSASIRGQLLSPVMYASGTEPYITGQSTIIPPSGIGYSDFDLVPFDTSPEEFRSHQ